MDAESQSISQDSSQSGEAFQMNTSVALHYINLPVAHCGLCRRIYSPETEVNGNENLNVCRYCHVMFSEDTEASIRVHRRTRTSRGRSVRNSWFLELQQRQHESFRKLLDLDRQHLERQRQCFERQQQDLQQDRQSFVRFEQFIERSRLVRSRQYVERLEHLLVRLERQIERDQQHVEHLEQLLELNHLCVEKLEQLLEQHAKTDNHQLIGQLIQPQYEQLIQLQSEQFLVQLRKVRAQIEISTGKWELLPTAFSLVIISEEHEKKHDGLVCAICTDPLSVGTIVNQLPCLHFYHLRCILQWFKVRRSCPTCRYKLSSTFYNEKRRNTNRRMGFREIAREGFSMNSSSSTSNVNETAEVVSESSNETAGSSVRDRGGRRGGWFLFVAAPIVSLVGVALVECFRNLLGEGRGKRD